MRTLLFLLLTCLTSFGAGYRIRDLPNTNSLGGSEMLELDDGSKSWRIYTTNLWKTLGTNQGITIINISTNVNNYSFSTNLYSTTSYISTNYSTNIYVNQSFFNTNYSTNLYTTVNYVTTNYTDVSIVTNLTIVNQLNSPSLTNSLWAMETTNDLSGLASNLVVNMIIPGLEVFVTNNVSITNFTGIPNGLTKTKVIYLVVTTGGPWTVTYPTDGASYGVYWSTNCPPQSNRPYTSVTNGSTYILSLTARGTNFYSAMTEWK